MGYTWDARAGDFWLTFWAASETAAVNLASQPGCRPVGSLTKAKELFRLIVFKTGTVGSFLPKPKLTVDQRQLLTTAAAITVTGVLPTESTEAATSAEVTIILGPVPVAHPPALNACAATAR